MHKTYSCKMNTKSTLVKCMKGCKHLHTHRTFYYSLSTINCIPLNATLLKVSTIWHFVCVNFSSNYKLEATYHIILEHWNRDNNKTSSHHIIIFSVLWFWWYLQSRASRSVASSTRRLARWEWAELQCILFFLQTHTWTLTSVLLDKGGTPESVMSNGSW